MRILYASRYNKLNEDLPSVFRDAIASLGELSIQASGSISNENLIELIQHSDIYLICRNSLAVPIEVAKRPGRLKLVVATVGSLRPYISRELLSAGIPVCNWGDAPADEIAEGTLALTLSVLSDLHHHIQERRRGGWKIRHDKCGGSLFGEHVGLYGYGLIARRFHDLLRPFNCRIVVYDPYADDLPKDVECVKSLQTLFRVCRIVSVHAGLTPETRSSVTKHHLAQMRDHGVIINTGRGAIIDQAALFAELETGRLRAGLDVLDDPDKLPANHPARYWENLILTGHQIHLNWPPEGSESDRLHKAHQYALSNIEALVTRGEYQWKISETQYDRMT